MPKNGWYGVDLDGTLAHHESGDSIWIIGYPIQAMVDRIKAWIKDGYEVRIVTARVSHIHRDWPEQEKLIQEWLLTNIGRMLPITCEKDFNMIQLWDDRCVTVEKNTGRVLTVGTH